MLLRRRGALPQGDERTHLPGGRSLKGEAGEFRAGTPGGGRERALGSDRDVPAPPHAHQGPRLPLTPQAERDCHLLGPGLSQPTGWRGAREGRGSDIRWCLLLWAPGASLVDGWAGGKHMA